MNVSQESPNINAIRDDENIVEDHKPPANETTRLIKNENSINDNPKVSKFQLSKDYFMHFYPRYYFRRAH
jgi:hypothetical protein